MDLSLTAALSGSAENVAARLLGSELVREINGRKLVAKIVETEAYDETDEASHSYHGDTVRTHGMFGPAGFLYVYFSYGLHYCMNVVAGPAGYGAAALIRAVEPIEGAEVMSVNRHGAAGYNIGSGPAKATQALMIDRSFNGHNLTRSPFRLMLKPALSPDQIIQTKRIGLSKATDKLWRFAVRNNKFVSHASAR